MIPMVDLKQQYLDLKEEIDNGLLAGLEETKFILGPNVSAFEEECAEYLGVDHTVGVASGTDALHLALIAAGVQEGDEVITTPFTFIATAEAIRYVGATPVFVDIDPQSYNMDPGQVEEVITERTRAILPVHIFGQPVDMASILSLAERHNLQVIEDCAQSFGAHIDGRQTGNIGQTGCFSFFPSKNLGGYGDGGLVSTNSDELAEHLRVLRNHGSWKQYHHSEIGFNSRLDELQAIILRVKLKRIDNYNENRRRIAHRYSAALAGIPGIMPPHEDGIGHHVYHQYTLLAENRDAIQQALRDNEIASAIYYPIPLHQQEVFASACQGRTLPVSERISQQCLSLPVFPELKDTQVDRILDVIREVVND
ncbi:MAG: erythromycin biosynthesis sensory transduction protein eryC1 [gamma proteobacterium symbiont of Ctena orbiculata]|uniref:DegT/DnrJ/EryC1/StrS family aminotransferase n=1 Tax=Candidatus Thiodiazotropha taylori TaxID=2792791 RepID=A0A944M859_9GAMM|nr:DegT/DnrJ/EryC1/StrS family aminotransferase [Candidatus Thiodiazotropha taylori]PUB83665.1 MAG: erythromycin biosynthesis sensory transduction protein eryC1 [gamma proteobacterium symbiont of Ctena orbiculata]MBT2988014.1 DegT/DnrJ/EryC1/StrS family aminotransferase [Candidatus Thiodiazotropha taylori]MBT2997659.1 DegT/DnrJ/EryC1/StrS family aminotransferase [Candidatus Thiodiazotropha taylori]MBT3001920.1 DegT/DnrJ/EryC1/StrS family aminotransferase [Candidatus Thiodiazotropha taylori]